LEAFIPAFLLVYERREFVHYDGVLPFYQAIGLRPFRGR
jgi:hypothetical protein